MDSIPSSDSIQVTPELAIPTSELRFRFSCSPGPGGQNVNRRETRVELLFDLQGSPSLGEEQRHRLRRRLSRYVDQSGILHVVASTHRKQLRNREEAVARFVQLLRQGLSTPRRRVPTRPSTRAVERRLERKRERGVAKERRRPVDADPSA